MTSSGVPTFLVLSTLAVHEISRRRIAMLGPTGSCKVCDALARQSCRPTDDSLSNYGHIALGAWTWDILDALIKAVDGKAARVASISCALTPFNTTTSACTTSSSRSSQGESVGRICSTCADTSSSFIGTTQSILDSTWLPAVNYRASRRLG
jgi:hypothetical protein